METCFDMKDIIDVNVPSNFQPICICFGYITLEK